LNKISYEIIDSVIMILNKPVFPAQRYIPFIKNAKFEFIEPDRMIYESTSHYPEIFIKNYGIQKKGCFRMLNMDVYPFHYIPSQNRLIYYKLRIKIEYNITNEYVKINVPQYEMHKEGVEKMVVNPEMIDSYRR